MIFKGSDGGVETTVLTFDMSSAGVATFTAPILAPSGSAAAPSYAFSAQGTTGMYKPGTNQLYFTVGGTRKIRVESTQIVLEDDVVVNNTLSVVGRATTDGLTSSDTCLLYTSDAADE